MFSAHDGKRVHVPTRSFGSLNLIFTLTDLISPGCNLILSGDYNKKAIFSTLFSLLVVSLQINSLQFLFILV